jgi:hypothetical protein
VTGVSPEQRPTPLGEAATARVRSIALTLPVVNERLSHGEATWFVDDKKTFVGMSDHHHDDRVSVTFAAAVGVQESLIASEPARYFRPPYVGGRGWVGAYLDGVDEDDTPDWESLADLIRDAWLLIAPMKLQTLLEE